VEAAPVPPVPTWLTPSSQAPDANASGSATRLSLKERREERIVERSFIGLLGLREEGP
jgi:hypothetical protein